MTQIQQLNVAEFGIKISGKTSPKFCRSIFINKLIFKDNFDDNHSHIILPISAFNLFSYVHL